LLPAYSLRPVKVAEPDTTVKPANEPVTLVVEIVPFVLKAVFAIFY
jgi:hypothetical protein